MLNMNEIGVGKKYHTVEEALKAKGMYRDAAMSIPQADRLQINQMPQGRDPMPFALGPMASGQRK
jgi:hypothetical protein